MSELFTILSQIGVYPVLAILWVKLDATQKSHTKVLQFLEEKCPHCGAVHIYTP